MFKNVKLNNNWLTEKLTCNFSKKVVITVFILALVDMLSMAGPWYLRYVIPDLYSYLKVSQAQYDWLTSIMGYVLVATQLPSGWLADKFSCKKLLIISCLMSGILTIFFGLSCQGLFVGSTQLYVLYIIYIGWGISTTLFLWAPLWKLLSEQGNSKEQGKLYGLQGSYNGLQGLVIITLIGTIATYMATSLQSYWMFYLLVYTIAIGLILSAFGTYKFIPKEDNEKPKLLIDKSKNISKKSNLKILENIKDLLKPMMSIRVWLISFFVLGMYMFQSVFAYYLKGYLAIVSAAIVVTIFAGLRTYGLRLLVSSPFGKWLQKRKSWVLTLSFILIIGSLIGILIILLAGRGNYITSKTSKDYKMFLQIVFPILFIFVGIVSWMLVAGRFVQIDEIPHTKKNYGTTLALISLIAFTPDAWFGHMASVWMTNAGYVIKTAEEAVELGYGKVGGYTQEGLQKLLSVACGIALFGSLCGLTVFFMNKREIKKLGKISYRWRRIQYENK